MDLPKISIVTPNYNYGHLIGETIESILDQDYKNIEHIIVDDGSTDNSVEIINSYAAKVPDRIKLIQQLNKGQTSAINTGLKAAKGEIIGWINSDDIYCKEAIKMIAEEFKKSEFVDIIFGDLYLMDQKGSITKTRKQLPLDKLAGSFIGFGKLVASNTVFWRTKLIDKIGFLNEEFVCNMDGEYFSRLFYAGKAKHINNYIACFRVHPLAISSTYSPEKTKRYLFEQDYELRRSYSKLMISRILPYKFSAPVRLLLRAKRMVLRIFRNHIF
jgi:glycosyltransferase involved in cell wall biosynthesis